MRPSAKVQLESDSENTMIFCSVEINELAEAKDRSRQESQLLHSGSRIQHESKSGYPLVRGVSLVNLQQC